jgi:hypothetical protein
MKEGPRLVVTIIIWIAFAALTESALTSPTGAIVNASEGALFGIIVVLALAAIISTTAMWLGGPRATIAQQEHATHLARGKSKRAVRNRLGQDRLARLIDELDDEDVYDLEALLLARDRDSDQVQRPR